MPGCLKKTCPLPHHHHHQTQIGMALIGPLCLKVHKEDFLLELSQGLSSFQDLWGASCGKEGHTITLKPILKYLRKSCCLGSTRAPLRMWRHWGHHLLIPQFKIKCKPRLWSAIINWNTIWWGQMKCWPDAANQEEELAIPSAVAAAGWALQFHGCWRNFASYYWLCSNEGKNFMTKKWTNYPTFNITLHQFNH